MRTKHPILVYTVMFVILVMLFSVTLVIAKDPQLPKPPYLKPGASSLIGIWNIAAGDNSKPNGGVIFTKKIGDEYFNKTADTGFSFALIPVSATNVSKKTDSLFLVFWELMDNRLYLYEDEMLSSLYLPEGNDLDLMDVPPGATRKGYIVMQVKDGYTALYFTVKASSWNATWKLK